MLFTIQKSKIVAEDIALQVGQVTQDRGIGTGISAEVIPYDATTMIKSAIDAKAPISAINGKADLNGNPLETFKAANPIATDDVVNVEYLAGELALKADVTALTFKADKSNVLELDNSTPYTPTNPYHPSTKEYVDSVVVSIGAGDMQKSVYDTNNDGVVDTTAGVGIPSDAYGVSSHTQVMRLAQINLTDCNTVTNFGIFIGTDVINAPVLGPIGLEQLEVVGFGKAQRCFSFTSKAEYFRTYQGTGPWSIWERSTSQSDIINNLLGSTNPYKVLHADIGRVLNETKSDIGHGHAISDVVNLQTTLTGLSDDIATKVGITNNEDVSGIKNFTNGVQSTGKFLTPFVGLKNHIIDGRFDFWYEGTSQTSSGYGSDTMWYNSHLGSTKTHTRQAFAVGETFPDGTLTPQYYSRTVVSSVVGASNMVAKRHPTEDVTRLAGKTVTLSFYAKADTSKNIAIELAQIFGTGGAPSATVTGIGVQKIALTTVWTKYAVTINIPSISGKTIGSNGVNTSDLQLFFWFDAGSDYNSRTNTLGQQSGTFDLAMVQLEEGSIATVFQYNPIEIEEMRVNRYYEKLSSSIMCTSNNTTTASYGLLPLKVMKRALPALTVVNAGLLYQANVAKTISTVTAYGTSTDSLSVVIATSGLTAGYSCIYQNYDLRLDARL